MERLETCREHPGTIPIHDALYRLLRALEGCNEASAASARQALYQALERFDEHPMADELRLQAPGGGPAAARPTLKQVLADIPGLPAREDPLEALSLHLRERREVQALLESRIDQLAAQADKLGRQLNLAVGVAVLLFILGALGWFYNSELLQETPQDEERAADAEKNDGAAKRSGK